MARHDKTLLEILGGRSDANIRFSELCSLLEWLGFEQRIRGSHHIFYKPGVEELINVQRSGAKAKPYQIKQVRAIIIRYRLGGGQ
ncbi:MAG: type II toxin-antitoxin system HicA family toxin [Planctomycetota bacterium]